jgi:hypothetical protein
MPQPEHYAISCIAAIPAMAQDLRKSDRSALNAKGSRSGWETRPLDVTRGMSGNPGRRVRSQPGTTAPTRPAAYFTVHALPACVVAAPRRPTPRLPPERAGSRTFQVIGAISAQARSTCSIRRPACGCDQRRAGSLVRCSAAPLLLHDDRRADLDPVIEIDHVLIGHANAAR